MSETEGINFVSWKALRDERDYLKAAYGRKLDDEKRALEAAQAANEIADALRQQLAVVRKQADAMIEEFDSAQEDLAAVRAERDSATAAFHAQKKRADEAEAGRANWRDACRKTEAERDSNMDIIRARAHAEGLEAGLEAAARQHDTLAAVAQRGHGVRCCCSDCHFRAGHEEMALRHRSLIPAAPEVP